MATEIVKAGCSGMSATGVSATGGVSSQPLELDISEMELLVKDLMGVASQCMFGNDIHPVVDSIANHSVATITEEELLTISPRYGDIVYNMLSLRENFQCPVTDLICDPLLPDMLDRDHQPSEAEATLALASANSYTSMDERNETAPSFQSQLSSSQFLPGPSLAEDCPNEPMPLSASFASGSLVSDIQPPPPTLTPPSSALEFAQPHRTVPPWGPPCAYGFSGTSLPTWGQQQVPHPSGDVLSAQSASLSHDSSLAANLSPGGFSCGGHSSLHELPHKQVGRVEENTVSSPSLSYPPSSALTHYNSSLTPSLPASDNLPVSQGQLPVSRAGLTATVPTSKSDSILSLRQLLQDKPKATPTSAPPPVDKERPSSSEQPHRRRHHHRRQPSLLYQHSIGHQKSSSEEESGHVGCYRKAHRRAKQQQIDTSRSTQMPGPSSPSSCQIASFPMMFFALGSSGGSNLVFQSLAGSPTSLASVFPGQSAPLPSPSSVERKPVSSSADAVAASISPAATGHAMGPSNKLTTDSSPKTLHKRSYQSTGSSPTTFHKKEERTSRRCAPHAGMKLWEFLLKVLVDSKHTSIVRWISREEGTFRVIDSEGLARLWGEHKSRTEMNYDKLSRAMRYYYHKNLLDKAPKRLCYQFKYYSRWWEKLELADPQFKMASLPSAPPGSPPVMDNFE